MKFVKLNISTFEDIPNYSQLYFRKKVNWVDYSTIR